MATITRTVSASSTSKNKSPTHKTVKTTPVNSESIGNKVEEVIDIAEVLINKTIAKVQTTMKGKNNENFWAMSAYIFFLLPLLGKKTSLTMYHAIQGLGYLVAVISINIITSILPIRIIGKLISIIIFIVWVILLVSAFRKEQKETANLYDLGKKIAEFLKIEEYFKV